MVKKAVDTETAKMAEKIWAKVHELQEQRKKAFEAHERFIQQHPPRFDCDRGCSEAAGIADQIEQVIATGKLLGLIDEEVDYMDYI